MTTAREYFIDKDYNCAESTLRLANDRYELGLTDDEMKLVAACGGGFSSGLNCGVLCACAAAISKKLVETKSHDCEALKPTMIEFVERFREVCGGTDCSVLKPMHVKEGQRCLEMVELGEKVLAEFMEKLEK